MTSSHDKYPGDMPIVQPVADETYPQFLENGADEMAEPKPYEPAGQLLTPEELDKSWEVQESTDTLPSTDGAYKYMSRLRPEVRQDHPYNEGFADYR